MDKRRILKEVGISLAYAFLFAGILFFVFWPFKLDGESMAPTFSSDDRVVISRVISLTSAPQRGDIVVCDLENGGEKILAIKRIVALPDEKIEIKNGDVFVDGQAIAEGYLENEHITTGDIDLTLGEDEYFVLGDNRGISLDSRKLGAIKKSDIKGKVILQFYPFEEIKRIK